jgi:hypothetical protein
VRRAIVVEILGNASTSDGDDAELDAHVAVLDEISVDLIDRLAAASRRHDVTIVLTVYPHNADDTADPGESSVDD